MLSGETYWWEETDRVHEILDSVVRGLQSQQAERLARFERFEHLYDNRNVFSYSGFGLGPTRYTYNVIKSCIDTLQAKIAKNKPKPTFAGKGSDWDVRSKARKLDKFVDGQFYGLGLYRLGQRIFIDSCVYGTGILKTFEEKGKVAVERVYPGEIFVDEAEAWFGSPRQIFQVKAIPRLTLLRMFPGKRDAIMQASTVRATAFTKSPHLGDLVQVNEGWHLPSDDKGKDGRHVLAIASCTLVDEGWDSDSFPFVFLRYREPLHDFWGVGLAEDLEGIQLAINATAKTIQTAIRLSVPRIFVAAGTKVAVKHLRGGDQAIGDIIEYTGQTPDIKSEQGLAAEHQNHLNSLYSRAYEIAGISQLSANSQKPAGLNSGRALQEYNDIESERFIIIGQAYEQLFLDTAKQLIGAAKDIYERDGHYVVTFNAKRFVDTIDWADIDLEEDEYVMQLYPTSALAHTPAGRLQQVQDMVGQGLIDPDEARELLDMPDLDASNSLFLGPRDLVREIVDDILDDGIYTMPDPMMNLGFASRYAQMQYNRAKADGAPPERLELLLKFITDVDDLSASAQPQQPAAPAPGPAPAMPGMPPMAA